MAVYAGVPVMLSRPTCVRDGGLPVPDVRVWVELQQWGLGVTVNVNCPCDKIQSHLGRSL